jgi:CRAL/TRIO domain
MQLLKLLCSGMGARHLSSGARAYTGAVGSIFDVNYTDMVKQLYIVGAPWAFHAAWKASQSFLSKDTRDKVQLHCYYCYYCCLHSHQSCCSYNQWRQYGLSLVLTVVPIDDMLCCHALAVQRCKHYLAQTSCCQYTSRNTCLANTM